MMANTKGELGRRVLGCITVYFSVLGLLSMLSQGEISQHAKDGSRGAVPPARLNSTWAVEEGSFQQATARLESGSLAWLFGVPQRHMPKEERLRLLVEENAWKNSLLSFATPRFIRTSMPQLVQTYWRCLLLASSIYLLIGAVWVYYAYFALGDVLFRPGTIPSRTDIWEQIKVSMKAMPLYSTLPAITEFCAEQGWTQAYPRIDNMGLFWYLAYFVMYLISVEFGVYWMHRLLHDIPWAYKWLHATHHIYNKEHTLSPFAGLAFHPLDGICQAVPYTWTLFFCPMHFFTHELLLFLTGVWTTNIHDCVHGKVWPIMGAGYHLIHHTTYKHNYGHYFTYCDWLFGTLESPEEHEENTRQRLKSN